MNRTEEFPRTGPPNRVLFVTRKWPPAIGGMEKYCGKLVSALRKRNVSVTLLALPGREDGTPPSFARVVWFFITAAWNLCWNSHRYDVVHFADPVLFPLVLANKLFANTPCVMTGYGLDMVYQRRPTFKATLYGLFLRWCVRNRHRVDQYIAISRHTASLMNEVGFRPVRVINLGVTLPEDLSGERYRDGGSPYLLFVGRLVPRKGARWFVENVLPELPAGVTLKAVGVGWDEVELEAVQSSEQAEWLGPVSQSQLEKLYAQSIATVMPNLRPENETDVEGFGLVALEAAAHGSVPVVARIQGLKDAVRNGKNGFLVQSGDQSSWVEILTNIMHWSPKRRQQFCVTARRTIERYYTWARVAERTEAVYRKAFLSSVCP